MQVILQFAIVTYCRVPKSHPCIPYGVQSDQVIQSDQIIQDLAIQTPKYPPASHSHNSNNSNKDCPEPYLLHNHPQLQVEIKTH